MKTTLLESLVIATETTAADVNMKHFRVEFDSAHRAWITFDMAGSSANVWNENTLREFNLALDLVAHEKAATAVVIRSAKDRVFIAGADLKALRDASARKLGELIDLGQATFNRLSALPLPKIALIHGACVGGGLELALACDLRLVSDADCTRLGLPETQIGLIPAWGGSTRLPKLLGLPKALDLIITGKLLKPAAAVRAGLAHAVMPSQDLAAAATQVNIKPNTPQARLLDRLLAPLITARTMATVKASTRGHYPAPERAVHVATRAPFASMKAAMEMEKHAILDLALTPETRRLIDFFFIREDAAKKHWPVGVALPVHDVTVIGAGVMGAGIAHWLASCGTRVLVQDIREEALAKGLGLVRGLLTQGLKRRAISSRDMRDTLDRLVLETKRVPLTHQAMVIEAATEDMAVKKKIFADLAARSSADTILATNTSALSVTELAAAVPHPERVIGLHFFNPVHRMPLVEIITTAQTSDDVIATAFGFVQKLGKVPVVVKDSPGFIVNRVLVPYLMEAVHLHESGVPVALIDEAMLEYGMPMGPLRLLDEIGLDVAAHVGSTLEAAFPGRFSESVLIPQMLAAGTLGKKTGQGFYKHPVPKASVKAWAEPDVHLMERVRERLSSLILQEAARVSAEGISRSDAEISLAMTLGAGFPIFRPLLAASALGTDSIPNPKI